MLMQEYETTVVIRPDIGGDAVEATLDRIRDVVGGQGGKLLAITHWGKKRLAYDIKKHTRGIYVHTHYLGMQKLVAEIERNLRISDNVLRYLTVNLDKNVDPDSRQKEEYVKPEYDAEEAAPQEESNGYEAASAKEAADPNNDVGQGEDASNRDEPTPDEAEAAPEPAAEDETAAAATAAPAAEEE